MIKTPVTDAEFFIHFSVSRDEETCSAGQFFQMSVEKYREWKPVIGQPATYFKLVNSTKIFKKKAPYLAPCMEQSEECFALDSLWLFSIRYNPQQVRSFLSYLCMKTSRKTQKLFTRSFSLKIKR